jgi:WD40 repeat protein
MYALHRHRCSRCNEASLHRALLPQVQVVLCSLKPASILCCCSDHSLESIVGIYSWMLSLESVQSREWCRGDYFVATCPGGASQSVVVHQLSKKNSQNPFRKSKGRVTTCSFHPKQPLLLVASETNVKVYNLVQQALTKTLLAGGGVITAMHIHPSGDHVLLGTEDKRCLWCAFSISRHQCIRILNFNLNLVCILAMYCHRCMMRSLPISCLLK